MALVGAERGEAISKLFERIWTERKGTRGAKKLLDHARRTEEGRELKPTQKDADLWVRDEPRRQVYYKKSKEWESAAHMGGESGQILSVDLLDLSKHTDPSAP